MRELHARHGSVFEKHPGFVLLSFFLTRSTGLLFGVRKTMRCPPLVSLRHSYDLRQLENILPQPFDQVDFEVGRKFVRRCLLMRPFFALGTVQKTWIDVKNLTRN